VDRKRITVLVSAMTIAACSGDSTAPAGAPVQILSTRDIGTQALAGTAVPVRPSVRVTDAQGRPVPGVVVTFSTGGASSITGESQTTNSDGIATVGKWTLPNTFGPQALTASAPSLTSVEFRINSIAPDGGVVAFSIVDPSGDTLRTRGGGPVPIDVTSVSAEFKRDSLILTLGFTTPVSAGTIGLPNAIAGEIEVDIDDSALTGYVPPDTDRLFGGSSALGVDYLIDLIQSDPSGALIHSVVGTTRVPASYPGNSMVMRIPMTTLGWDDGNFSLAGVIGTSVRATDIFPNSGAIRSRRGTTTTASSLMFDRAASRGRAWKPTRLRTWLEVDR
jgi:hypothetical protein